MGFLGFFKKKDVPSVLPDLVSEDIEAKAGEVHDYLKDEEGKSNGAENKELPAKKEDTKIKKEEDSAGEKKVPIPHVSTGKVLPNEEEHAVSVSEVGSGELKKEEKQEEKKEEKQEENKKLDEDEDLDEYVKKDEKGLSEDEKHIKVKFNLGKNLPSTGLDNEEKSFFEDLQKNLNEEIGDLGKLEEWYNNKFLPRDIISDMKGYWEKQKTASIIKILGKNFQEKISVKIHDLQKLEREWQNIYFDLVEKEEEIKDQERDLKELLSEFMKICKRKSEDTGSEKVGVKNKLVKTNIVKTKAVKKRNSTNSLSVLPNVAEQKMMAKKKTVKKGAKNEKKKKTS